MKPIDLTIILHERQEQDTLNDNRRIQRTKFRLWVHL